MFNHTGENGFHCSICELVFNRKSRLEKHIKQVHNKAGDKDCDTSKFIRIYVLNLYAKKSIANFSELKCDQCNETFLSKPKLTAHKKTHKENICKKCNKIFPGKNELIRHIQIQHQEMYSDIITTEVKKIQKRMATSEIITPDVQIPSKRARIDEIDDNDDAESSKVNEYHITYQDESNVEATIVLKQEENDHMINFTDDELTEKVRQLLNLLVDDDTLAEFGWPAKSVEDVLSLVIEQCDQVPADYSTCPDYATKIRENTKLLFTTVIDNDSIKELLNNQTIDEVILHVLKTAG